MVRIDSVDDSGDFGLESLSKRARATNRDSKGHRVRILADLHVVQVSLAGRLQFVVYDDGLVEVADSHSKWLVIEWINFEGAVTGWQGRPVLILMAHEATLCGWYGGVSRHGIGHLAQHVIRIVVAAYAATFIPAPAPGCYKKGHRNLNFLF